MNHAPDLPLHAVPGLSAEAASCLAGYGFQTADHVVDVASRADGLRGLLAALAQAGLSDEAARSALEAIRQSLSPEARAAAQAVVDVSLFGLGALDPATRDDEAPPGGPAPGRSG